MFLIVILWVVILQVKSNEDFTIWATREAQ